MDWWTKQLETKASIKIHLTTEVEKTRRLRRTGRSGCTNNRKVRSRERKRRGTGRLREMEDWDPMLW